MKSLFALFLLVAALAYVSCENPERTPNNSNSSNNKQKPRNDSVCRYNKGQWSECSNGEKFRIDNLKNATPNCEATRRTTKKCKPACRYSKGEWTPCENGEKKRTLTRLEGDGPECEPTKLITKQCGNQTAGKKNKQPRNKNRKSNSSTVPSSSPTF